MSDRKPNPWQLYSSMHDWEEAAQTLDRALAAAIAALDRMVASGTPVSLATHAAFVEVLDVMERPRLREYGASDTEPREHLAICLQKHIRATHKVKYYVSRFGDVTEN